METKESRRVQMTKLLLKTALMELMQEKPFEQITIKELCEQADLNRTTFYLHYDDQRGVLKEIEQETMEKTVEFMKNVSPDADTIDMVEAYLSYVRENAMVFRTLLLRYDSKPFRQEFVVYTLDKIRDNLPYYGDPEHERYVLTFLMEGSNHIIMEWIRQDFDLPAREVATLIYKLCNSVKDIAKQ